MARRTICSLLLTLLCSVATAAQTAPAPQAKINIIIIIDRETIRFAPQELAQEMRLVVTDQTGAELYDSGSLSVSTLDWLLRDSQGGDLKGGLYLYTLTAKDAAGEARQQRGYLIVNRAGDSDRVYVATADKVGIGAGSEVTQVTVIGSPETTVGGAELSGTERGNYVASGRSLSSLSERVGMQRDAQGRSSAEAGKPGGAQQYARLAPTATPGRLAKFAADGVTPVDTQLSESNGAMVVGNAGATGNIQIFGPTNADVFSGMGPDVVNGPAFNYGYAGSSFGRSAGFFNVRPDAQAVAPNPSLRFLTANQQRMIITNTGNIGIGTTNPSLLSGGTGRMLEISDAASPGLALTNTGIGGNQFFLYSRTEGTANSGSFRIYDASNGVDRFVLNNYGKVGIGTTTPNGMFHVNSIYGTIAIRGTSNDYLSAVGVLGESDRGTGVRGSSTEYIGVQGDSSSGTAVFGTADSGTGVAGRSVSGYAGYFDGKVAISSSTANADTNTAIFTATGIAGSNSSHIHYGTTGDWYIRSASSAGKVILQDFGGKVGIGLQNPDQILTVNGNASKTGGGSWAVFSDERLKTIKGRFTTGLKAVMQLQPLRYEYKPKNALGLDAAGEHIGFGAQAVQRIIPEAVTTNDRGYLLVNNDPILWTMLNAIKEQQQQITQLRRELRRVQANARRHGRKGRR